MQAAFCIIPEIKLLKTIRKQKYKIYNILDEELAMKKISFA